MKILVPVDGSAHARKALDYLARHRGQFIDGHSLVVVHVCPGVPGHVARHLRKGLIADYYAEEAAKVIEPVKARLAEHGIADFTIECRHGRAAQEILKLAAASGADMVVLGTHGHGLFGRALLGPVATRVLGRSGIAVLLVP